MRVDPGDPPSQEPAITPYLSSRPSAAFGLRLFCFHHAGGGASVFGGWQPVLGGLADVLPVQLPGREKRVREPRITDRVVLVDELEHHLGPFLRPPYALYGHSMGARIAYDLTRQLLAHGRPLPDLLLVGAASAPHLPALPPGTEDLPDDQMAAWLIQMGGMSPILLNYPEWLQAATSLVRDDLSLCRTRSHPALPPLPCPIQAFAGKDDPIVRPEAVAAWAEHTQTPNDLRQVPGGHLFIRDSADTFLTQLASVIKGAIPAPAGTPHDKAGMRVT